MSERPDFTDTGAAFVIGALVGVGLALLLGSGPDGRATDTIRILRGEGISARLASRRQVREMRRVLACVRRIDEVDAS